MQYCPLGSSTYRNGEQCASRKAKQTHITEGSRNNAHKCRQSERSGNRPELRRPATGVRAVWIVSLLDTIVFAFSIYHLQFGLPLQQDRHDKKGIIYFAFLWGNGFAALLYCQLSKMIGLVHPLHDDGIPASIREGTRM
jgi:hypothetical protein